MIDDLLFLYGMNGMWAFMLPRSLIYARSDVAEAHEDVVRLAWWMEMNILHTLITAVIMIAAMVML